MWSFIHGVDALLVVRTDGNSFIGSGHVMRCASVAQACRSAGEDVLFAVSDNQSVQLAEAHGLSCAVLDGNFRSFDSGEGRDLADLVTRERASAVLVDSYAVSDTFFAAFEPASAIAYIDDQYTFAAGRLAKPHKWMVDCVINYGFDAVRDDYEKVYGSAVRLCIGPAYAPVRREFCDVPYEVSGSVESVLVTTGATNPHQALERMVRGCRAVLPEARIDVVVGPLAAFEHDGQDPLVNIHQNVLDMSSLMASADFAVSAAGSTLYELSAVGVPTVALPIVDNQLDNVNGFSSFGLGLAAPNAFWTESDVSSAVESMASDVGMRSAFSEKMREVVDGKGASRIAEVLLRLAASA